MRIYLFGEIGGWGLFIPYTELEGLSSFLHSPPMPKLVLGINQSHCSAAYLKARFRGLEFVASAAQPRSDHLVRPIFM
jgi:hypothetical protein